MLDIEGAPREANPKAKGGPHLSTLPERKDAPAFSSILRANSYRFAGSKTDRDFYGYVTLLRLERCA
jgi:hypothetical protein